MRIGEALKEISANNVALAEKQQQVYDAGVAEGFDAGRQAEYDAFWDAIQPRKGDVYYYSATFGQAWTTDIFKPKYDVTVGSAVFMFAYNQIGGDLVEYFEHLGKKLDFSQCGNANNAFQISQFTRLGGIYCSTASWYNTFASCTKLETIDEWGNYDENGTINGGLTGTFSGCTALKNLTVKGVIIGNIDLKWSVELSKASIMSVINHLSPTTTYVTLTLSKDAVQKAFETVEGANDGTTSTEWLALIATKPGWTISLV